MGRGGIGTVLGRLATHGVLLAGCVVFAFPFAWLVSTSLKYDEEIFVDPPRWIPAVPPGVDVSPYVSADLLGSLPPEGCPWDDDTWQRRWPGLAARLWARAAPRVADLPGAAGLDAADLRGPLTHGWVDAGARSLPSAAWDGDADAIAAALVERVDEEGLATLWDRIYRTVAVRAPVLQTVDGDVLALPAEALAAWHVDDGRASLEAPETDGGLPARRLAYDFGADAGDALRLHGDFALPAGVGHRDVLGLTLPLRQDRSWHAWRLQVALGGQRYTTRDDLFLEQVRWQEVGFRRADLDDRDQRDLGVWPLEPVSAEGGTAGLDRLQLTLTVERASRWQALWRKYGHHYRAAQLATQHWWSYVGNSVYLVVLTMLGQALSCSLVAYAFARLRWPGRELFFGILLATMMLPPQVTMIPVFMVVEKLGWYNSLKALWAPSFLGSAFFIFLLRQFMRSIPDDLEDAAKIDGCSFVGIYWRIILPLVKPALAAVCIFTFMGTWNDFMGPLIYINDQRLYPLALGLFDFRAQHQTEFGMLMAASTLMTLPVIALFFLAQRYFIQGVTLTGMKG